MKKELKDKWLSALRSGEYRQGAYHLHADGKWCPLGILLRISDTEGEITKNTKIRLSDLEHLGLRVIHATRIIDMNDFYKNSFEGIADYVEDAV